eukprot:Sspe_Gene.71975::Locus_42795_Transcript_1_1_Confidence_1.000_Length_633::g.71975::m.71975
MVSGSPQMACDTGGMGREGKGRVAMSPRPSKGVVALGMAAWYLLSGTADTLNYAVVSSTYHCLLPTLLTFASSAAMGCMVITTTRTVKLSSEVFTAFRNPAVSRAGGCIALGLLCMLASMACRDMQYTYALKTTEPLFTTILAWMMLERVTLMQM